MILKRSTRGRGPFERAIQPLRPNESVNDGNFLTAFLSVASTMCA